MPIKEHEGSFWCDSHFWLPVWVLVTWVCSLYENSSSCLIMICTFFSVCNTLIKINSQLKKTHTTIILRLPCKQDSVQILPTRYNDVKLERKICQFSLLFVMCMLYQILFSLARLSMPLYHHQPQLVRSSCDVGSSFYSFLTSRLLLCVLTLSLRVVL